jgi:mono/diheme cytochrome c family protein
MKWNTWINVVLFLALLGTTAFWWFMPERNVKLPNDDFLPEAQMAQSPASDSSGPDPDWLIRFSRLGHPAGTIARGHPRLHYQPNFQDGLRAGEELHFPTELGASTIASFLGQGGGLRNPWQAGWTAEAVLKAQPTTAARRERGGVVFTNYCQVCHGPLGQGNGPVTQGSFPPPASLQADRAVQMKDGHLFHVLTYGQGNMPSFSTQLSREDRWNVVLHIRMLQGPYAPGATSSRFQEVARVFRENCAACHGQDGTGGMVRKILPLIPDFTSQAWQLSQTELALVNQIDYGTAPLMPAFRYRLTREQVLGLAVYIRAFATQRPGSQPLSPPTSHLTAASVYGTYCFACHDTNGKGISTLRASMPELPDFTGEAFQKARTDAMLAQSILQGKGKFMLPMKDKLGTVDVKQMVALVRAFEGGKQVVKLEAPKPEGPAIPKVEPDAPGPPEPEPKPGPAVPSEEELARVRIGANIFRLYCIVCHGPDGTGSLMRASMPAIPDFTSEAFHKQHNNAQIRVSILEGKGALMPANRGRVTENEARDLVAYLRAFGPRSLQIGSDASDKEFEKAYRQLEKQLEDLHKEMEKAKGKQ